MGRLTDIHIECAARLILAALRPARVCVNCGVVIAEVEEVNICASDNNKHCRESQTSRGTGQARQDIKKREIEC